MNSKDGIMGFVVGDAMGVPVEFLTRERLMENPVTEMIEYGSHNVPKGTWSDDTSMTIATIDSIIEKNIIDLKDIANKFVEWMRDAKYTAENEVFDIGRTTLHALAKCEDGIENVEEAGGSNEMDNGNGSLMRMLPLVYYCYRKELSKLEILKIVKGVSSITHRHEISIMGCYIYVLFGIELLKGESFREAYKMIKSEDYSFFSKNCIGRYERILKNDISNYSIDDISSQGYVVSTLEASLWLLLNTESYNQVIIGAINLGNDTDTIAACAGGLAGVYYEYDSINKEWIKDIIKSDYILDLCEKFDKVLN